MKIRIYSKKKLIFLLKKWAREHGETPSKRQWNEDANTPSDIPYRINFGSWGKALKICNLMPKDRPHKGRKVGGRNKFHKRIIQHGYVMIFDPKHRQAMKNGYVREHRMIMSDFIGKRIKDDEHVHHKNENKKDNRLQNLELISCAEHTRHHWKGRKRK